MNNLIAIVMIYVKKINSFFWSGPLLVLLLGTHVLLTIRTGFVQRYIFKAVKLSIKGIGNNISDESADTVKHDKTSDVSDNTLRHSKVSKRVTPLAALMTTLAATLGTGNIVGVSTAIACGGPGALLWCWLTGILGMATTYAECNLGICYRKVNDDGSFSGGPMYTIMNGLHNRPLAVIFAIALLLSSCGMSMSTQARTVTESLSTEFGFSPYITGIILALIVGLVILGGIKKIGSFCTRLVPIMAVIYTFCCMILIVINFPMLGAAIRIIFESAFVPRAIAGGLIGGTLQTAMRYGVARGLFTNEAGLGSAAITAADVDALPHTQSLISMSATFWDTVVMCALTGIVIVTSLLSKPDCFLGYSSSELTTAAFSQLGRGGTVLLTLSLCGFAVCALIGWSYFGERAADFLFGGTGIKVYRFIYILMIYLGSILSLDYIWELSDLANAFMAVPNVLSLILLFGTRRSSADNLL